MKKIKLYIIPTIATALLVGCIGLKDQANAPKEDSYHLVDFDSDGGSYIAPQQVMDGTTASEPQFKPVKQEGDFKYTFDGWYEVVEGEMSEEPFDFQTTLITNDVLLRAKWSGNPPEKDSYELKINCGNCKVNGVLNFDRFIVAASKVQIAIVPNDGYFYPKNDSTHFDVRKGKDIVKYNENTGIIVIDSITEDVEIVAISESTAKFMFKFNGTNCKINNENPFEENDIEKGSNLQFTINPDVAYMAPQTINVTEGGENVIKYRNGVISISNISSNITISATALSREDQYNTVSFAGIHCMADINSSGLSADYNFVARKVKTDSLTLHLFVDDNYNLPDTISVTFSDGPSEAQDYTYDKTAKTITINKQNANAFIALSAINPSVVTHKVTLSAGDGVYLGGKKNIQVEVVDGTNLSELLSLFVLPTCDGKYFYRYGKNKDFTYDSTITTDMQLTASYLDAPLDNLNEYEWKEIKNIAICNPNPSTCINLGATKEVTMNEKTHIVRVIDFNHDQMVNYNRTAGIVFDFFTLISDNGGNPYRKYWDNRDGVDTVNTDFVNSEFNIFLNGTKESTEGSVYKMIPEKEKDGKDGLRKFIEPVTKKVGMTDDYVATPYETKLFPLADIELFGEEGGVAKGEGKRYAYYGIKGSKERIKKDANGKSHEYWLRSPRTPYGVEDNQDKAFVCDNDGESSLDIIYSIDNASKAIAPAFCI